MSIRPRFVKQNRRFWNDLTPDWRRLILPENQRCRTHQLVVPLDRRNADEHRAGAIGTAVDYSLGWVLGDSLSEVLQRATRWEDHHPGIREFRLATERVLTEVGAAVQDRRAWIHSQYGELLSRIFLLLADMDVAVYRTANPTYLPNLSGFSRLDTESSSLDKIARISSKVVPTRMASEVIRIAQELVNIVPQGRRYVYNPRFGGYRLVLNADGDLLIDHTLYELKCRTSGAIVGILDVHQLLGYAALNQINNLGFRIREVGIINPRRRLLWQKSLDSICEIVGAGTFTDFVDQLQERLDTC